MDIHFPGTGDRTSLKKERIIVNQSGSYCFYPLKGICFLPCDEPLNKLNDHPSNLQEMKQN